MEEHNMRSPSELLRELQRLNRTGVINDEEFLVLRRIIRDGAVNSESYRRFDQLFVGNSKNLPVRFKEQKQERLYSITEAIDELNLKLTSQSGFNRTCELITCPACGMFEGVAADGKLITAESEYPGDDTGLKFTKVAGEWECPDCGHIFPAPFTTLQNSGGE